MGASFWFFSTNVENDCKYNSRNSSNPTEVLWVNNNNNNNQLSLLPLRPDIHIQVLHCETVLLFDVEKTTVSVLHKELEYKVEKRRYSRVGGWPCSRESESN